MILTILFVTHTQDNLGCSVVSRHYIRGHHEASAGGPSQSEIQDLESAV